VSFTKGGQIDKDVQKMVNDFQVISIKPSTDYCLLCKMDDRICDPKSVSNMVAKAQKTWFREWGDEKMVI
jgi:hypothetical protein